MNNHKQINNVARSLPKADMSRILAALVFAVTILFSLSVAAISEAELEAELNSGNNFERVNSSEFQFQKGPYIEQGQKSSQNIDSFHARLLQNRPAVVPSEEVTKWIPIAGDITIFVPKKETAYPLAKRVGDQFVQERLVRLQMYNTLGRHLLSVSYSSEAAQIDALYNNAYDLANRSGFTKEFGDQLVQADINPYGLDVIWPEIRRINGEDVLVPVLHLSAQTLENQLVDGHTVEFIGPGAQFNNITIESGSITTRKNALLQAAQNFIVGEGATFTSEGDMNLAVGGTLLNHGQITAEQNINILAGNYVQKTAVHRFHSAHGLGERLGLISTVNAGQSLTIESLSDIAIFGANVQAGNDIVLDAQGNITIGTVALSWQESHGLRNNSYQRSSVEHIRSSLTAGDNIKMMAGGLIEINAATLHADQGHIELLAELGVTIIDELNQQQYVSHRKFGNLTEDESSYVTIAMRAVLDAGKGIRIHTADGDITLRATDITSVEGTSVHAANGAINMLMTVENDHYSYNSIREKLWTITTVSEGHNIDTAVPNTIIGGFQAEALYGVNVEYEGDPELSHAEQVAALSKMPGMEWMAEIQQQNPDIDWQAVETVYEEWKEKKTSLSPAALAVIAIVVTVCTAGAGAGFVGAGSGTWQAAVANAAFSSMASTAIIATSNAVVNGESFDDVLTAGIEAVHSDDGMKSVATAVVTAGAIWYVDTQFFIPSDADVQALAETRDLGNVVKGTAEYKQLFEELSQFSLGKQALQAFTHATAQSAISTIADGGSLEDFGDNLEVVLMQDAVNTLGQYMATEIGDAAKAGDIATAVKYISHAGAGCLTGILSAEIQDLNSNESCFSGAGGSVIGEFVASQYDSTLVTEMDDWIAEHFSNTGKYPTENDYYAEANRLVAHGISMARVISGFSAFLAGMDVNLASASAGTTAQFNALKSSLDKLMERYGRPVYRWRDENGSHVSQTAPTGVDAEVWFISNGQVIKHNLAELEAADAEALEQQAKERQAALEAVIQRELECFRNSDFSECSSTLRTWEVDETDQQTYPEELAEGTPGRQALHQALATFERIGDGVTYTSEVACDAMLVCTIPVLVTKYNNGEEISTLEYVAITLPVGFAALRRADELVDTVGRGTSSLIKKESGGTLIFHENLDGHTIREHVGKTDDYLLARLADDLDLPRASTFTDLEMAERAIGDTLLENRSVIDSWLFNPALGQRKQLTQTLSYAAGRVINREDAVAASANKVVVIIERDSLAPNGYKILTSYLEVAD